MGKITALFIFLTIILSSCTKEKVDENEGYNMLLMGHSFFRPYAERLEEVAIDAGYKGHIQTNVIRGGENGRALDLWNSTGNENTLIKEILDNGNVDFMGMTGWNLFHHPTDGYREWINYALVNNPDIKIFISISPIDFPNNWEQRALDYGFSSIEEAFDYHISQNFHQTLIDSLRSEFPSTNIFSIPTGRASKELSRMYQDGLLLDSISHTGPYNSSLFTDEKGHQGKMIVYTGALMWLNGLYQVDLSDNNFTTGFNTDLHSVAQMIMNSHEPDYNQ